MNNQPTLRIAIIGAGFSGTALTAALRNLSQQPIEIVLCEKTGNFGPGEAYKTPMPFHLLNVRARDMSIFHDQSAHFVTWLKTEKDVAAYLDCTQPVEEQFVPRMLYGRYLKNILDTAMADKSGPVKISFAASEVIDVETHEKYVELKLGNNETICADKVVLALGNGQPDTFPFPVAKDMQSITNPWDYTAVNAIPSMDPVLIVGTGLSMIDTVLTLHHQQHRGMIYAVSRHGLLPLPHAHMNAMQITQSLTADTRILTRFLRTISHDHDWRSVVTALRSHIPGLWQEMDMDCRKRFLRHVLPYWNIHRHRVHHELADLLKKLNHDQQLTVLAGRIENVENDMATIRRRHTKKITQINVKWLINCMGPPLTMSASQQPLISSLLRQGVATFDPLKLGFAVTNTGALQDKHGNISSRFFTLGPPAKGKYWESGAVPEIRVQSFNLAKELMNIK